MLMAQLPDCSIWGISATIGNLEEAKKSDESIKKKRSNRKS